MKQNLAELMDTYHTDAEVQAGLKALVLAINNSREQGLNDLAGAVGELATAVQEETSQSREILIKSLEKLTNLVATIGENQGETKVTNLKEGIMRADLAEFGRNMTAILDTQNDGMRADVAGLIIGQERTNELLEQLIEAVSSIKIEPNLEQSSGEKEQMGVITVRSRKPKWIRETPTGTVDGNNATFRISAIPIKNTDELRLNMGAPLANGVDYTLSGNVITYVIAPPSGSQHEIKFQVR